MHGFTSMYTYKFKETIKFTLSRFSFAQMLINLFADCAYLSVKQTFEFESSQN